MEHKFLNCKLLILPSNHLDLLVAALPVDRCTPVDAPRRLREEDRVLYLLGMVELYLVDLGSFPLLQHGHDALLGWH